MTKTYDPACLDLANKFLHDSLKHLAEHEFSRLADLLAKDIQRCVESFFMEHDLD